MGDLLIQKKSCWLELFGRLAIFVNGRSYFEDFGSIENDGRNFENFL